MIGDIFKWSIASTIFAVGFLGLLILAGDDDPYNPMPLGKWFMLKAFGAALIYAAYLVGKLLYSNNLFPESFYKDFDEEDEL